MNKSRRDFMTDAALIGAGVSLMAANTASAEPGVTPKDVEGQPWVTPQYIPETRYPDLVPRKIEIPDVTLADGQKFHVYKGDFHTHTCFSDGSVWPSERVLGCYEAGLDVIAITDHIEHRMMEHSYKIDISKAGGYNASGKIAQSFAKAQLGNKFIVIQGAEISKPYDIPRPGHLNALFLKDVNAVAAKVNDWRAMVQEAYDQGAFIMWNHPRSDGIKRKGDRFGPCFWYPEIEEIYKKGQLFGVECYNDDRFFVKPLDWACDKNLALLFDTDIHGTECRVYGHNNQYRPMTLLFAKEKTEASIRETLFAKRTVGWGGNLVAGQEKFVRPLFDACVQWKREGDRLVLKNASSIPCKIRLGQQEKELRPKAELVLSGAEQAKSFTVINWLVRTDKPLSINL